MTSGRRKAINDRFVSVILPIRIIPRSRSTSSILTRNGSDGRSPHSVSRVKYSLDPMVGSPRQIWRSSSMVGSLILLWLLKRVVVNELYNNENKNRSLGFNMVFMNDLRLTIVWVITVVSPSSASSVRYSRMPSGVNVQPSSTNALRM